jgi:hypothetical protein
VVIAQPIVDYSAMVPAAAIARVHEVARARLEGDSARVRDGELGPRPES